MGSRSASGIMGPPLAASTMDERFCCGAKALVPACEQACGCGRRLLVRQMRQIGALLSWTFSSLDLACPNCAVCKQYVKHIFLTATKCTSASRPCARTHYAGSYGRNAVTCNVHRHVGM